MPCVPRKRRSDLDGYIKELCKLPFVLASPAMRDFAIEDALPGDEDNVVSPITRFFGLLASLGNYGNASGTIIKVRLRAPGRTLGMHN